MYKYLWHDWVELMGERGVRIPVSVIFRQEDQTTIERPTRLATLDELSSAIVFLEDEIERLVNVKTGLLAIHHRVYRSVRAGGTPVEEALGLKDKGVSVDKC